MRKYDFCILVVEELGFEKMGEYTKKYGLLPRTPVLKHNSGTRYYFFGLTPDMEANNVDLSEHIRLLADGNYDGVLPENILQEVQASLKKKGK